jgi:hypothetical protein
VRFIDGEVGGKNILVIIFMKTIASDGLDGKACVFKSGKIVT